MKMLILTMKERKVVGGLGMNLKMMILMLRQKKMNL